MIIEKYTKEKAEEILNNYQENGKPPTDINEDYLKVRSCLQELFETSKERGNGNRYKLDVEFGTRLYDYFENKCPDFNHRWAADEGFWRFMAVGVIPHLIKERFSGIIDEHYWSKPTRIWPYSLWWYVHLSWQGSIDETRKLLLSPNFSTDTILNLVERSGCGGYYVSVYRAIMKYQSKVKGDASKVFRAVMKLNTAKSVVVEPALFSGGEDGYVRNLFAELGQQFE